jgi:hypothetical protein
MTDISNFKIKVVAGMATLINPIPEVIKHPHIGHNVVNGISWQEHEQFAAENTFATDAPDTKEGEYYEGSWFRKEEWQIRCKDNDFIWCTTSKGHKDFASFTQWAKNVMGKSAETRRYRPFLGTTNQVEENNRFEITESGRQYLKFNSEVRITDKLNEEFLIIIEGANFTELDTYAETILKILNHVK